MAAFEGFGRRRARWVAWDFYLGDIAGGALAANGGGDLAEVGGEEGFVVQAGFDKGEDFGDGPDGGAGVTRASAFEVLEGHVLLVAEGLEGGALDGGIYQVILFAEDVEDAVGVGFWGGVAGDGGRGEAIFGDVAAPRVEVGEGSSGGGGEDGGLEDFFEGGEVVEGVAGVAGGGEGGRDGGLEGVNKDFGEAVEGAVPVGVGGDNGHGVGGGFDGGEEGALGLGEEVGGGDSGDDADDVEFGGVVGGEAVEPEGGVSALGAAEDDDAGAGAGVAAAVGGEAASGADGVEGGHRGRFTDQIRVKVRVGGAEAV